MTRGSRIGLLEGVLLLVLGGFAALFLAQTWEYGETAAFLPRLVAAASLVLLALALAVHLFGKAMGGGRGGQAPAERAADAVPWPAALAAQIGFVVLIVVLGFPLAMLLYLLGAPLQMHYRRWRILAPYTFLLTAVTVVLFIHFFNARLPEGILWAALRSAP